MNHTNWTLSECKIAMLMILWAWNNLVNELYKRGPVQQGFKNACIGGGGRGPHPIENWDGHSEGHQTDENRRVLQVNQYHWLQISPIPQHSPFSAMFTLFQLNDISLSLLKQRKKKGGGSKSKGE